jgi:hypothetical protein
MKIKELFLVMVIGLFAGGIGYAELFIESESAIVDFDNMEVSFNIVFSRIPDFYTTDGVGRQADAFQYYIDFDSSPIYPGSNFIEAIISGGEIHVYDEIPFRDTLTHSPDPTSGGWGEIRGLVPYELNGRELLFTASLATIGDLDGQFGYGLGLFEYGIDTDWVYVPVAGIPEPTTIFLLGLGCLTLRSRMSTRSITRRR